MSISHIPRHRRSKRDRDKLADDPSYPGVQKSQERDPGGNPINEGIAFIDRAMNPTSQYDFTGGGLLGISTQDEATDLEHAIGVQYDGGNWAGERAHANVQWDEEYGYAGTGDVGPYKVPDMAVTGEELHNAMEQYAHSSYKNVQLSRDVATDVENGTVVVSVGADAYPITGDNWELRSVYVRALAANTGNVLIGKTNVIQNVPGTGVFVLEPGKDYGPVQATSSIAVILPAGAAAAQTVTYRIERYEE